MARRRVIRCGAKIERSREILASNLDLSQLCVPLHAAAALEREISQLHDERRLEAQSHGSSWRLPGLNALEKILDVQVGGPPKSFFGPFLDRRRVFGAFHKNT